MMRQVENAVDLGESDADLDARIALAKLYASRGFPELAIEHYRAAEALNSDAPGVSLLPAKSLREMNALEEASNAAPPPT